MHEPGMKVFGQHPVLVGWGISWGRVPPGSCLPASLLGAAGSAWSQGLVIALVRGLF